METPSRWSKPAIALMVTGGVLVATGIASGVVALNQANDVRATCDGSTCPRDQADDADRARLWANISTVAFAVGAVDILGATLLVTVANPSTDREKGASAFVSGKF